MGLTLYETCSKISLSLVRHEAGDREYTWHILIINLKYVYISIFRNSYLWIWTFNSEHWYNSLAVNLARSKNQSVYTLQVTPWNQPSLNAVLGSLSFIMGGVSGYLSPSALRFFIVRLQLTLWLSCKPCHFMPRWETTACLLTFFMHGFFLTLSVDTLASYKNTIVVTRMVFRRPAWGMDSYINQYQIRNRAFFGIFPSQKRFPSMWICSFPGYKNCRNLASQVLHLRWNWNWPTVPSSFQLSSGKKKQTGCVAIFPKKKKFTDI